MNIYDQIIAKKAKGKKQLAVLVDPDKTFGKSLERLTTAAQRHGVDYFFVGGSLITDGDLGACVRLIKNTCSIPVVLFPGGVDQIDANADALLFLSLISGRNSELLIGHHVTAAPLLMDRKLEVIPTGYILIESGTVTTVQYVSNTLPIPSNKTEIAAATALAGEFLGMKLIFAEAGSGARNPVSVEMISAIKEHLTIPLIVGGGIRTPEKVAANFKAGADLIVIGNSLEKNPELLSAMAEAAYA